MIQTLKIYWLPKESAVCLLHFPSMSYKTNGNKKLDFLFFCFHCVVFNTSKEVIHSTYMHTWATECAGIKKK